MIRGRLGRHLLCGVLALGTLAACSDSGPPATTAPPPVAKELVLYDWAEDVPQSVLDAFEAEYGIRVVFETYETTEEAVANIRAGKPYDLAVVDSPFVSELVAEDLLAEIDPRKVPNVRNLSANFRDLVFDPGNRYSVTYNWGLTGLIARADRVTQPLGHWADLWDPGHAGKVMAWELPRYLMGIALKSLGYSVNSEDPAELEAALQRLLALRLHSRSAGWSPEASEAALAGGEALLMYGFAGDVLRARARNLDVRYVIPAEGSIQWGDNFVIPRNGRHRPAAELLLDFLLRPEIAAQIVNEQHYATANEAAHPHIRPEILSDPVIFPPAEEIRRAEVLLPLSPAGRALRQRIWQRYLASVGQALDGDR
jgi:spermidine/putrescine transport system substrate-binding protein